MLYIVTAVHNRYEITEKFIAQLKAQTFQKYRLVLVDDGSTDGTASMVKMKLPDAVILTGDGNLWWGGALHKAYKYLVNGIIKSDDMVMYCNDDITIDDKFLEMGVKLLLNERNKLISAKGIDVATGEQVDGAIYRDPVTADGTWKNNGEEGNCASTRALFVSGHILKKIGGFHPVLLPHYLSDFEYTIRASRKGFPSVAYDRLIVGVHSDTTGDAKVVGIKKKFSKRYMNNPIYKLNFILMVTPVHLLPAYILHLLKRRK